MDTETFLAYFKENLKGENIEEKINIDEWIYGPGLPSNIPVVNSNRMAEMGARASEYSEGKFALNNLNWASLSYQEKVYFLSNVKVSSNAQLDELSSTLGLLEEKNNEVLFTWLELAVKNHYTKAYNQLTEFLTEVGRRKFVAPLYEDLVATNQKDVAAKIYQTARKNYHAVTVQTVDALLYDSVGK
ncbi:MAG: leukotriene A4 hydrolase C-terminal domain-containing protein [Flavobacteriales bacterium]